MGVNLKKKPTKKQLIDLVSSQIGFEFVKQYLTIPGASNFEQLVNQWELSRNKFEEITHHNKELM
jgi:hypothetical protein